MKNTSAAEMIIKAVSPLFIRFTFLSRRRSGRRRTPAVPASLFILRPPHRRRNRGFAKYRTVVCLTDFRKKKRCLKCNALQTPLFDMVKFITIFLTLQVSIWKTCSFFLRQFCATLQTAPRDGRRTEKFVEKKLYSAPEKWYAYFIYLLQYYGQGRARAWNC